MDLPHYLKGEKIVAGIEISDTIIRVVFFHEYEIKEAKKIEHKVFLFEKSIGADIIADGVVLDSDRLSSALEDIWKQHKIETDYAIVSIPDNNIYTRVFAFPRTIEGTRAEDAMRLAISYQLPISVENAYLDWERTPSVSANNEILFSSIPRKVAQGYINALERAGIKTIAMESHLTSIARAVKTEKGHAALFTKKNPEGTTVFAVRDGVLRFARSLPLKFVEEGKVAAEVEKIRTALSTEYREEIPVIATTEAAIRNDYATYKELVGKAQWVIALGAAIRGQIPEGTDNLISLLPVGTEEAFVHQRLLSLTALIRNLIVAVSVFFVIMYASAYLFILSLSQSANNSIMTLSALPPPPDLLTKQEKIGHTNELAGTVMALSLQTPHWSTLLAEIDKRTQKGVIVTSFSAPSLTDRMTIAGIAQDRPSLNQLKKTLQDSPLLTEVDLPLTNLDLRKQIPFSVSFRVKDPRMLSDQ